MLLVDAFFFFVLFFAHKAFFFLVFVRAVTGCGSKHVVDLVRMQLRKGGGKRWVEAEGYLLYF